MSMRGHESLYLKRVESAMLAKSSHDLQSFVFIIRQGNSLSLVLQEHVSFREGRQDEGRHTAANSR